MTENIRRHVRIANKPLNRRDTGAYKSRVGSAIIQNGTPTPIEFEPGEEVAFQEPDFIVPAQNKRRPSRPSVKSEALSGDQLPVIKNGTSKRITTKKGAARFDFVDEDDSK